MNFSALINPAGGLRYHVRGWLFRNSLWTNFRRQVSMWLSEWIPSKGSIILVGPSGGYCLPMEWISQFDNIIALEPDAAARGIFLRRLDSTRSGKVTWIRNDLFLTKKFDRFLAENACTPVLFSNIVGQFRYLVPDKQWNAWTQWWRESVNPQLQSRSWASFHDRVSGFLEPQSKSWPAPMPTRLSDKDLLAQFYKQSQSGELNDHLTGEFMPKGPCHYMKWRFTRNAFHLVEASRFNSEGSILRN